MKTGLAALAVLLSAAVVQGDDKPERRPDLVYAQPGGQDLLADLYVPTGEGPFPGVLVIHGGGWRSGGKTQMRFVGERLAANGYVAMCIAYRLAPDHKFPAQVDDCLTAVHWMRDHASEHKIDPQRIGAWGYSAGGHLAAMLGAVDSSAGFAGTQGASDGAARVQAVVAGGAPCDFRPIEADNDQLVYWLGETRGANGALYERASPAFYVSKDDPPVFFYHGDKDSTVEIAQAKAMDQALQAAGVPTEFFVVPGAEHIKAIFDRPSAEAAIKFLDKHLKGGAEAKDAAETNGAVAP